MSQARMLALAFIVVGGLLAIVSALADQIGFGAPGSSFGWKQLLGLVLGIVILAAGFILLRQGDELYDEDEEEDEEFADEPGVAQVEADNAGVGTAPGGLTAQTGERSDTGSGATRRVITSEELRDDAARGRPQS